MSRQASGGSPEKEGGFTERLYTPIGIYMGKLAGAGVGFGLLMQLLWLLAAYWLARFVWARGIKKYAAFGG